MYHQVYRQLNIGSAKVSDAEAGSVRHHLLDVADPTDPDEIFSAKTFADLATKAIEVCHLKAYSKLIVVHVLQQKTNEDSVVTALTESYPASSVFRHCWVRCSLTPSRCRLTDGTF